MKSVAYRITLFPSVITPLTEELIMRYITILGDLKYLPSVNRGVTVKMTGPDKFSTENIYTLDLRNSDNGVSVSVTAERIDFVSDGNIDLDSFSGVAFTLIAIMYSMNPSGYNRLAAGAVFNEEYSWNDLEKIIGNSTMLPFGPQNVEWSERAALRKDFKPNGSESVILYNDVTSIYVNRRDDGLYDYKNELDVNTAIPQPVDLVNRFRTEFFTMALRLINDKTIVSNE